MGCLRFADVSVCFRGLDNDVLWCYNLDDCFGYQLLGVSDDSEGDETCLGLMLKLKVSLMRKL